MAIDRFTGFGLAVALLGWGILVANAVASPWLDTPTHLSAVATLRSDVFTLAQTTIGTGFALAVIGTLRSGFGALHRFFDAVLERAGTSRPKAGTPVPSPAPAPASAPEANTTVIIPVVEHAAERPATPRPSRRRNYTILDNGAVEVDTLLGTRIFASLEEARDYIR